MTRTLPLVALVTSTLAGVVVGAVLGAELHIDVSVPATATATAAVATPAAEPHVCPEVESVTVRPERRERRRRVTRRTFRVDRDAVLDMDSHMGRALLHRNSSGDFDGYRLSAIRQGSMPDRFGLENGDVVHSVDGLPLSSMQDAMEAYEAVSDRDQVTLSVTRHGDPVEITYVFD